MAPHEVGHGLAARRTREGNDVCIIGVGKLLGAAEGAAELLESSGISTTVWDPRAVKPLDETMLADAARHRLVVTAEDGLREGGAGSGIADALGEVCEAGQAPKVRVLGTPMRYLAHGKPDDILAELGLDAEGIASEVRRSL